MSKVLPTCASYKSTVTLEDFFFSDFAKSPSSKLYGFTDNFVGLLLDSLPFYGFSADSMGKQSSFYTNRVRALCNIAHFLSPSTPYAIPAIDYSVLHTFEGLTCGRTRFFLSQHMHNLCRFFNKISVVLTPIGNTIHKNFIKFFPSDYLLSIYSAVFAVLTRFLL